MYDTRASHFAKFASLWGLMMRRWGEGHLPPAHQLWEILVLRLLNGLRPPYYFTAGLYRREVSWREKLEFVGHPLHLRLIRHANHDRYQYVFLNKMTTHGLLKTVGVPTPTYYGFVNSASGQTHDGHPLRTPDDLAVMLRRERATHVCFKPVAGSRGKGFHKVTVYPDDDPLAVHVAPNGPRLTLSEFWEAKLDGAPGHGHICQAEVEQHPEVAEFNPSSLNTARVWMYQPEPGDWRMFAAMLRMGAGPVCVDNIKSGGMGPGIDIDTGVLATAVERRPERTPHEVHPVSGKRIEGFRVPFWDDVLPLCQKACRAAPFMGVLGIDVAFSIDGPVVIEMSGMPDENQTGFARGVKSLLKSVAR